MTGDRYEEWTSCEEYGHTFVDATGETTDVCVQCGTPHEE